MSDKENQQFIFGCVFILANKMQLLGDQITKEITLKQWFLLNTIQRMENKSPNFMEIAREIGSSRQNVSKMVSALEKRGMVKLQPSSTDQRAVFVTLTQKCFDYFNSKESTGNTLLDTIFSGIPAEETKNMAGLLYQMLQNAETALKEQAEDHEE